MGSNSPDLCRQCAAQGRTCCQQLWIFLTSGDAKRIAAGGFDPQQFVVVRNDVAAPDEAGLVDPIWFEVMRGGREVRFLAHNENGDCVFLTGDGCCLPMVVRPLLCRLYPFDYTPDGIRGVFAPLCPESERGFAPLLLARLGMDREAAEGWREQLYAEIAGDVE